MAKIIVVVKAILTRVIFALHGFIAIWRAQFIKNDPYYWYLTASLLALSFEGVFTLSIKKNQEWKWFCPSVFFYLCSVVPAIWLIEVDKFDKKFINATLAENLTAATTLPPPKPRTTIYPRILPTTPYIVKTTLRPTPANGTKQLETGIVNTFTRIGNLDPNDPKVIPPEYWDTAIVQFLMLILIIGRWMLPKGGLTRDQLSQLLLVYIGTAADIIEFFDSFKDEKIAKQRVLCLMILGIWSWSLLQFTVVLTATKARRTRITGVEPTETPKAKLKNGIIKVKEVCCSIDVWAILINIILQDAPFMIFRVLLITYYDIISYMNIFFTCKNTLVIVLQFYRLYVVQMEKKKEISKALKANVTGNLAKAIGQAAFLGRQVEARRQAAAVAGSSKRSGSAGPSSRHGISKNKHRSQESISSRNTRYSEVPSQSGRSKGRRKSLSTGNLRAVNNREEEFVEEEIIDDLEAGVSCSVLSGTNNQDSQDESDDAQLDDISIASERPKVSRKNIRVSRSRSSQASSDRGQGQARQDTGYSSSSRESGASSRRGRPVQGGSRNARARANRPRSSSQRRSNLISTRNLHTSEFFDIEIEQEENLSPAENERI
ncbi:unnamed protein product [Allacma fusca]|uniref:Transmembrane protein 26 n=1 Tax=Allacma fusca TaxID=39272 RepID=A0A8J2Q1G8_9HEXA|nr:unnamed protein product [Allacma fusca]